MKFSFVDLPYPSDSLEPYIDQKTMEIHHGKHHKAYYDNFIKAIADTPQANWDLNDIFKNITDLTAAVRNNGGGYYNHNFYWSSLSPNGKRKPSGKLLQAINSKFGDYDVLVKAMNAAGMARFGSGFAWLIINKAKELEVISTPNQNNPLMSDEPVQGTPLLAIDVWEHAYYLRHQNKRADYLEAFWSVVDWTNAESIFEQADI